MESTPRWDGGCKIGLPDGSGDPHLQTEEGLASGHGNNDVSEQDQTRKLTANGTRMGLTLLVVPVPLQRLPIGVQIIASPRRDDVALPIAYSLEKVGPASAAGARVGETSKFVDEPASLVAATKVGQLPCSRCCGRW